MSFTTTSASSVVTLKQQSHSNIKCRRNRTTATSRNMRNIIVAACCLLSVIGFDSSHINLVNAQQNSQQQPQVGGPSSNQARQQGGGSGGGSSATTANRNAVPPVGLFERLDLNHDSMLSVDEYNNGWPLIAGEFPSNSLVSFFLPTYKGGFWKGFTSGVAMILATEIGDKTFFIAAVLSMRQQRSAVFLGAIFSLYLMTVLSSIMGVGTYHYLGSSVIGSFQPRWAIDTFVILRFSFFFACLVFESLPRRAACCIVNGTHPVILCFFSHCLKLHFIAVLPKLIPVSYTHILGGVLFLYFGIKLLLDAKGMDANRVSEELEEVEEELLHPKKDEESQEVVTLSTKGNFTEVAIQSFTLTFLAEWGDRSQIATIALSAAKNPYGVTLGGCIGHTMCTGLAVLGGRMLAARISERTVNIGGGIIFLVFGIHSVFFES